MKPGGLVSPVNQTIPDVRYRHRAMAVWLLVLCAMVFAMVVLGGVTRLTHSGLSMVEWRPATGWLPPLNEAEWEDVFAKYRQFPEYMKINATMSLPEFKAIYRLEFLHRLWGRLIGVAFIVPFAFFAVKGWVDRRLAAKLAIMFVLGGLQGALGWYMVKSGLADRPDVSQYRLTAHLGAALVIYGYMLWVALGLLFPGPPPQGEGLSGRLALPAAGVAVLIFVTALSGGFVAGLDAGLIYNTFPLMDGQLVPDGLFSMEPPYLNVFEDIMTVQFDHRVLAVAVVAAVAALWLGAPKASLAPRARLALDLLALATAVQAALGVSTLLLVVPVFLAATHQAGAVVVFSAALWTVHELRA